MVKKHYWLLPSQYTTVRIYSMEQQIFEPSFIIEGATEKGI